MGTAYYGAALPLLHGISHATPTFAPVCVPKLPSELRVSNSVGSNLFTVMPYPIGVPSEYYQGSVGVGWWGQRMPMKGTVCQCTSLFFTSGGRRFSHLGHHYIIWNGMICRRHDVMEVLILLSKHLSCP